MVDFITIHSAGFDVRSPHCNNCNVFCCIIIMIVKWSLFCAVEFINDVSHVDRVLQASVANLIEYTGKKWAQIFVSMVING